jgi:hypothetical protein
MTRKPGADVYKIIDRDEQLVGWVEMTRTEISANYLMRFAELGDRIFQPWGFLQYKEIPDQPIITGVKLHKPLPAHGDGSIENVRWKYLLTSSQRMALLDIFLQALHCPSTSIHSEEFIDCSKNPPVTTRVGELLAIFQDYSQMVSVKQQ